ncbi:MAG: 50S ribosomal protein L29 [Thermodesulfovibrionales bacterium]|nr:50S ribosomal protein L29 [Thermodesulfovibrionales bacterium]
MKASTFRAMSIDELKTKYLDLKKELFNLRFRLAKGDLDNNMRVRQVKKDIVRVLTVITEKEKNLLKGK